VSDPSTLSIPLSLYVHIPWCIKKCPYCDFNSHEKNQRFDEQRYVDALIEDLDKEYESCQRTGDTRSFNSIFFGGGTPSLFSAEAIQQIIDHARKRFLFDDIEVTLEANPGTFEQEKFDGFRQAGINRLSIGIQSFNADHLEQLGRIHDDRQAYSAIETALNSGFDNINLDLMFGLPQQSIAEAIEDVTTACSYQVAHISHYQLTIEENTFFHRHRPTLPENESIWEMQSQCQDILGNNSFEQYEISAYARKPGHHKKEDFDMRSKHNLNYWRFGDYIGIGAGAHGKITEMSPGSSNTEPHHRIIRRWKHRQPQQYMESAIQGDAVSGQQQLDKKDIVFEYLLNALRLKDGCDVSDFENNTGLSYETLKEHTRHIDPSLLLLDERTIKTTGKGFLFLNDILEKLI
jgi:oxygen-independent coproporphyrinogen-3 oxidase